MSQANSLPAPVSKAGLRMLAHAEDIKPLLVLHGNGGVSLDLDGEVTLHFPSLPAYDAWQETVDRSRAALGQQQALRVVP